MASLTPEKYAGISKFHSPASHHYAKNEYLGGLLGNEKC